MRPEDSQASTGLHLNSVTYSFRRHPVLSGVSASLTPGITAILGPNGAGKTTLLKCVLGLLEPKSGTVGLTGVSPERIADAYGYVPQETVLPHLAKVRDVVAYAGWLSGLPSRTMDQAADQTIERLGLSELAGRRVRALSGGQRRRAAIACGLVHEPSVLILDEPTAGLDPGQRLRVRDAIAGSSGADRIVVLSTHLLEDVRHLADRILVLVRGRIGFDGTVSELTSLINDNSSGDGDDGLRFERGYENLIQSLEASES